MSASLGSLFRRDPAGFLKRALLKVCVGPFRYGRGESFDPSRFWKDRYSKYGLSLKGSGDEGFSEAENRAMYDKAAASLLELAGKEGVDFAGKSVLDIGCGTGYYTALMESRGVAAYTGVDVTDVLFAEHRKRFPRFEFRLADAARDRLEGRYDVVLLLDVIQNIVTEENLAGVLASARQALAPGGVLLVAPVALQSRRTMYYMRYWTLKDLERGLAGLRPGPMLPFRDDRIACFRARTPDGGAT